MLNNLENYLLEAAGREKGDIPAQNPYREIAFDGEQKRLGWVNPVSFKRVKKALDEVSPVFEGKQSFIFVGMGGSINGLKPLIAIFGCRQFYALDNLDPASLESILKEAGDLSKAVVVSISKSGTTRETQLLSLSLKEAFMNSLGENNWQKHFLWLSDPDSFQKLDSLGWNGVKKAPIQCDSGTDIGGRFSSPHTLIFLLPLFLLLNRDFAKLEEIYGSFVSLQGEIRKKACLACEKYKDKADAYFSPITPEGLGESFSSWIVQLFQESLGSKKDSLAVKTIANARKENGFSPLELDLKIRNPAASLMGQMYFFQIFMAYYSALKNVNFVNQSFVEKYKNRMRELEGSKTSALKAMGLSGIIEEARKKVSDERRFIEVVLYFYPQPAVVEKVKEEFSRQFSQKVLVFIGSDWNHQSYQAAFADKNTFYVLLVLDSYKHKVWGVSLESIERNINTLKTIAEATYLTIEDKSFFGALSK